MYLKSLANSAFLLIFSLSLFAQDPAHHIQDKLPGVDSLIRQAMEERKIPGLVIGIGDSENLLMLEAYGLADVQNQAPVRENTRFELASITKQFTASAILILEQQGKLSVDDKVSIYLDYAPPEWSEITLRHLLTHTSGLPGLWTDGNFNRKAYSGYAHLTKEELLEYVGNIHITKERLIKSTKTDLPVTRPGDRYNYSDVGYATLGIVIDNITGSYRDFLKKEIFDPAGMTSTYIVDQEKIHPLEARGYSLKNDTLINIRRFWQHELPSHYGVFSTVEDMYRWSKILDTDKILSEESKKKLWEPVRLNDGSFHPYGFGWSLEGLKGSRIVSHTGVTGTSIAKLPDDGLTVIVLTNLGFNGNDGVRASRLGREVVQFLDVAKKTKIGYVTDAGHVIRPLSRKNAKRLQGEYRIEQFDLDIKIQEKDGEVRLVGPMMNEPIAELDNGKFILLNIPQEMIFTPGKDWQTLQTNDGVELTRVGD